MGLRRIDDTAWLFVDADRDAQLARKRALLVERRTDVMCVLPAGERAWDELLRMLVRRRPHGGDERPEFEPFGAVQEDFCVLTADGSGPYVLTAACVCFPSHWRLADKMGAPVDRIHAPVPRYDEELATKVDAFLAGLAPGSVYARRNWTIHESDELFAPEPPLVADLAIPPEQLWLRTERQTLRHLPETGAIVFSIHTQQARVGVLEHRPDIAGRLADRLAAQPTHKTYGPHLPALLPRLNAWRR